MPVGPVVKWYAGETEVPWVSWEIARFRNEPAKFSVELAEEALEWAVSSDDEHLASLGDPDYPWTCEATWPDGSLDDWEDCPHFVQDDYQFSGEEDANKVEVSGTDFSVLLMAPQDEAMDDVVDEDSHDVLAEIFTAYGVSYSLDNTAYEISEMHRIGSPLDWVRQILEIYQDWYIFEGSTLKVKRTVFPATPSWTLTDREHLKVLSYRRNLNGVYNTVTVERTEKGASNGIVARVEKSGGDSLGIQTWEALFDPPVYWARPVINVKRGTFGTFVYKDSEGGILTGTAPAASNMYFSATDPASTVVFTVTPNPDATTQGPYTPQYSGYFVGGYGAATGDAPEDYSVTYADSADVAIHGTRRYHRPISNSLVGTAALALIYATRWVAEALRTFATAEVEILFNPHIVPGQTVRVTDYYSGIDGDDFLVDAVYHTGSTDSITTRLELSRPAALE